MLREPLLLAVLTPPGRGAIATLALRGPDAWDLVRTSFQRAKAGNNNAIANWPLPEAPVPGTFSLGWLGDRSKGGADQVVLLVKQIEPVPWLELHCHGGPEVIRLLQELFMERGAQLVSWPQFERGHASAWRVAAQEILAQAPTVRTAAIALDQWHGAFQRRIGECRAHWTRGERETATKLLRRLIELVDVGRHLVQPWRVVLAGAPNVGKSSLGNALAGFARSIVAPTPGTTRDALTTMIALDGWPIELTDTAGLRHSGDALEQAGIERTHAAVDSADLCVWLVDGAGPPVFSATPSRRSMVVINKIDLPPAWDWDTLPDARQVSAKTGVGVSELCELIVKTLVPSPPEPGGAAPHTEEQWAALARIDTALRNSNGADDIAGWLSQLP
jgi:tRNA modification GTPase